MIGLPTGDVSNAFNLACGLDLIGEYSIAYSLALVLNAGYVDFSMKSSYKQVIDYLEIKINTDLISVLAGIKYNFSEDFWKCTTWNPFCI